MLGGFSYTIIFYILFFVILGLGVLIGFLRGLKKSLYSFVVKLIFFVVFFLTVDLVTNALWVMDFPFLGSILGQIDPAFSNSTSLKEALPDILNTYLGDSLESSLLNEEFIKFVSSFSLLFVKLIYAIIYFTIFYLIYKFIFFIIRIIVLRNKKDVKVSKNRGIGALCGLLSGAVTLYFFLIFLGGTISVAESSEKIIPEEYMPSVVGDVVNAYNDNLIVKSVNLVGVKNSNTNESIPLNLYLFDTIFSFEYRNEKIALRNELTVAADVGEIYNQSTFKQTENLSDITGDEIREAFNILSTSDFFTAIIPLSVETAADYFDTDITLPKEELYAIDWETEIMQLGEVAAITFDLVNSAGILDDDANLETRTFNGDHIRSLCNSLSESDLVTLAAYNAIEPILAEAGSEVEAIITVPEDLVWEEEFIAMGQVAGQIVDTGITVADLESGEPSTIISSLSQLDFTIILDSKIISHAMVNIISGKGEMEGFDVFVVPDDVVWFDVYDSQGNITQNGELRNILLAVNELSETVSNVDFSNLDMNIIADFTDDAINQLFESRVLVATVSTVILDMDLGNTPLIIADSVFDENDYILKTELSALVTSARMVVTTLACDEGQSCDDTGFDMAKAFNLSDEDIDILLSSQIIGNTIGDLIIDNAGEILTIPSKTLITISVDEVDLDVVSIDEIKKLFKAISPLGFTDLENMTFDASIIENLATEGDSSLLDETKANNLFNSDIIHATLSTMLFDLTEGESQVLVVPYEDFNEIEIRFTDEIEYVTTDELEAILQGVLTLAIDDFNEVENLDINLIIDNIDTLLDSAILHATISDQFFSLGDDVATIPYVNIQEIPVRKTVGDIGHETEFISKDELRNTLDALDILGITDINNFTGDVSLDNFYDETNQDILLSSAVMHSTISKQILDLGDSILKVPFIDSSDNPVRLTVGVVTQETEYVLKDEIKAIIEGLEILEINDVNNFTGTIDLTKFYEVETRNTLLTSASLHATVSKQIFDLGSNILVVPQQDFDGTDIKVIKGLPTMETEYIIKNEIHAIFESLEILNIGEISNFTGTVTLDNLYDDSNQNTLLSSASMHATVSKQMNDLGSNTLLIPDQDIEGDDIHKDVLGVYYVEKLEIKSLINALEVLGINDITTFNNSFDLTNLSTETKQNTLLTSASIHATISKKLFDLNDDVLIVPMYTQDGEFEVNRVQKQVSSTDFVIKDEIKSLIDAFLAMSYTNLDSFGSSIDSSKFFNQRSILLNSSSIQATLSNKMLTGTNDKLIIPNTYYINNEPIRIVMSDVTYVELNEMNALLDALELLNLTDFSAIDMNPSNVFNVDFDTLLLSASVQATISDNILENALDENSSNPGDLTLIVPIYFREDITVGILSKKQIEKDELKDLLSSLDTLAVTDFDGAMNASTITSMSDSELDIMFLSGSIHTTVDNMLKGNSHISNKIPDKAIEQLPLYNINNLTKTIELKAFIKAANTLAGDFTSVTFDVVAVSNLSETDQDIVLSSMIVRNTLTDQLEPIINSTPLYSVSASDYEDGDITSFFTKPAIKQIIDDLVALGLV